MLAIDIMADRFDGWGEAENEWERSMDEERGWPGYGLISAAVVSICISTSSVRISEAAGLEDVGCTLSGRGGTEKVNG